MLGEIRSPADLRALPPDVMPDLAQEIRRFLIQQVSKTGGHLGPNLGVVELTLALHRVFDSPTDAIIWDTGHQSYVHKMLTGRSDRFGTLRKEGGLSGYPSRSESDHDWVENSHASTALSYADGLAKAWELSGELASRHVVAVVGDGSLTGGMAWEALNNIAASDRPLIVVVNDNARSYSPTIGGVANHLATLRTTRGYDKFLEWGRKTLNRTPVVGKGMYDTLHGVKKGVKDVVAPQGMFEDLGIKYLGPVDGHDEQAVERILERARDYPGPVIVHAITQKGHGFVHAEADQADRFHGIASINPDTGIPLAKPTRTWTGVFSETLVDRGRQRQDLVAITAAMPGPTGLAAFEAAYPDRFYDVGIAEQHAVTSAAGLAMGGLHPVVALYATFLNRAYDQVLLDVALHQLPVTFVLDRSGVTGDDGPSHNGIWDLSLLSTVPGLRVAAPRDAETLVTAFDEAIADESGPTVVRFPKGAVPEPLPRLRRAGDVDVLAEFGEDVLIVGVGAMAQSAVAAAQLLRQEDIRATVVDPRWVLPTSQDLVDLAKSCGRVVVVEDGVTTGGIGDAFRREIPSTPLLSIGIDKGFLEPAARKQILLDIQLTSDGITERVQKWLLAQ
ncbi:MAG: 1-deoxy-D-xylulose-5-phosphate synthase [Actinomycetia bacterium]|nr:1-deoxy-D-xylulose-5-phosphate synthase [Actinomycetes bacterium]